ncbi:MAG: NAD(+)--dinitrogen-reductase ADP-D-ribosyltransferase [Opitutales bacterium]|jgi:NAD+--dinitrogen-reductase ADP-D-ribosyltransferase
MPQLINLCNIPPWVIASSEFNEEPRPLELDGVVATNKFLFQKLNQTEDPRRRGEIFNEYMSVRFNLHEWGDYEASARSSLRNSYLRFLSAWGLDSNTSEGAVLKGWVESRMGIRPTFHKVKLTAAHSDEDLIYAHDRMKGSARTNAIYSQFDVLYEFCQYELRRRGIWSEKIPLYRGTNDADEYLIKERGPKRNFCVRMNNLCSFTMDREKAWEFGSTVWQTQVPLCKIFFFSGLLPDSILRGEDEFMVVGGDYWVRELLY